MSDLRTQLLGRLRSEDNALARRAVDYLLDERTRLVGERSTKVSTAETLRLWSTRFGNEDLTGQELEGVEKFLNQLRKLSGNKKLEQFAFIASTAGGNIFFEAASPQKLVGIVLFNLPKRASAA